MNQKVEQAKETVKRNFDGKMFLTGVAVALTVGGIAVLLKKHGKGFVKQVGSNVGGK